MKGREVSSLLLLYVLFGFGFCCSAAQSYTTLCDPMDCSISGFPVLHYLTGLAHIHVHCVGDAIWFSGGSISYCLEKEMATHFSILARRIPWKKKADRLQSMGSQRPGHD